MKTLIYGASDDLIIISGEIDDEVGCFSSAQKGKSFSCSDGTQGTIKYNGEWKIELSKSGDKFISKIYSVGDDKEHIEFDARACTSYSDVLVLGEGVEWVMTGKKIIKTTK